MQKVYKFIAFFEEIVGGADATQTQGKAFCEQDGSRFLEDIGASLWVLCGDQFLLGYCRDGLVHKGGQDSGVKNLNIRVQTLLFYG